MTRIALIGAGSVGANLARRLVALGHDVVVGARDPARVRPLADEVAGLGVSGVGEAGRTAEIVVVAVPADQAHAATAAALAERPLDLPVIVVDATNDVAGGGSSYDAVVAAAPDRPVEVVKAFNTIGAEALLDPVIDGRRLFLPIAGPAPAAEVVRELAASIGFDALVIGGPESVVHLEAHARMWIHLAIVRGLGRGFGFARLER